MQNELLSESLGFPYMSWDLSPENKKNINKRREVYVLR